MSCNCIKDTKESLKERFSKDKDVVSIEGVSIENTALMFGQEGKPSTTELYSPLVVTYTCLNRKQETKVKKYKANLLYKYCPLCGKPYSEADKRVDTYLKPFTDLVNRLKTETILDYEKSYELSSKIYHIVGNVSEATKIYNAGGYNGLIYYYKTLLNTNKMRGEKHE